MTDPSRTDSAATARRYHEATKHSPQSVAASRRVLDWANTPLPFKLYTSLEPIPLPTRIVSSDSPALGALADGSPMPSPTPLDLAGVTRLCILSNGITRVRRYADTEMAFRAAGTTGALYHVELYLACADLPDLPAGIYHFSAHDNSLRRLRQGDHRGVLVEASGFDPGLVSAPLVVIATSTFWRNAWKYEARAWRHTFWDSGTVLANLPALCWSAGMPARVILGFADPVVNALLDVAPDREAAVWLVGVGQSDVPAPPYPPLTPLGLPVRALSKREIALPAIAEVQAATSLSSPADAAAWRSRTDDATLSGQAPPTGRLLRLPTPSPAADAADSIERVIRRRGSTRRFTRRPIAADDLEMLLRVAAAPIPADFEARGRRLTREFLIANAVDGIEPGAYLRSADGTGLEQLRAGQFRDEAGWLALGQDLGADAAVNIYWLTDLDWSLGTLGGRGYRAAQLDAAIRAGRAWLAAYALRMGATGLTFFDDDVCRFFGQDPSRMGVMFLLAAGVPSR